jgi:type II restriction enzyme
VIVLQALSHEKGRIRVNIKDVNRERCSVMPSLTTADLASAIDQLDKQITYPYVGGRSAFRIREIIKPEGGVIFQTIDFRGVVSAERRIPADSLATVAAICTHKPNFPLQLDRLFNAGGNTRSALESMLAYTSHFFVCYPERLDSYSGRSRRDLRHIMWCPEETHPVGQLAEKEYLEVINEVENSLDFGNISLTLDERFDTIEAKRTHIQMQVALVEIGNALGLKTWVASNDRATRVGDSILGAKAGVVSSFSEVPVIYTRKAQEIASLIDCLWIAKDGRQLVAAFEVEHTTGITPGVTRMAKLREELPSIDTLFVVVASEDMRTKVVQEANTALYRTLNVKYMSYSTVRELYGLVQKYRLAGNVDARFILAFLEQVVRP